MLNCTVTLQTCHNIPAPSALRWRKHSPSRRQNDPVPAKPNFQEPKVPDLCSKLYVKILQHELPESEQKLKHFILESQTQDNFYFPRDLQHTPSFDCFYVSSFLNWTLLELGSSNMGSATKERKEHPFCEEVVA